jgi:NAD(P)-dependent dehydrogenase (short-subunit alcohol dehydrogenase family)
MKVAIVVGASRGIGASVALKLSLEYFVVILSKTLRPSVKMPGSLLEVQEQIQKHGGYCDVIQCDCTRSEQIIEAVDRISKRFDRIDVLVYNAGAISWGKVLDTTLKKYDLMHDVNERGLFLFMKYIVPIMDKGRIVVVCPPIYSRFFRGKTTYAMTKVGMSVLVSGFAMENQDIGICGLWPATALESHVTKVQGIPPKFMRKATIFADACYQALICEQSKMHGRLLIDEDFLRECGQCDFEQYRCEPHNEPPRMMPKHFPSLLVEEQEDSGFLLSKL